MQCDSVLQKTTYQLPHAMRSCTKTDLLPTKRGTHVGVEWELENFLQYVASQHDVFDALVPNINDDGMDSLVAQ